MNEVILYIKEKKGLKSRQAKPNQLSSISEQNEPLG